MNGKSYTSAGIHKDTLKTSKGCDSIFVLTLSVYPIDTTPRNVGICSGGDYDFFGNILTTSGVYYHTLQSIHSCDSVIKLNLTVNSFILTPISAGICKGDSYPFKGGNLTTSGVYYDTLTAIAGCDSIVELTLTVNQTYFTQISDTILSGNSYNFHGKPLSLSGVYLDTLPTLHGCDSIVELTLTVNHISTISLNASTITGDSNSGTIRLGLDLPNNALFSGNMLVNFPSGFTLDEANSVLSPALANDLSLSITPQANNTWELNIEIISSSIQKKQKAYQDILTLAYTVDASVPDGIYTAHLQNLLFDFTDGSIAAETDIPINITVNRTTGIVETASLPPIRIYPNPTDGKLRITNYELREGTVIEIFDVYGKNLTPLTSHSSPLILDISHLANGMYFLKVDGKVFKIMKQ